MGLLILTAREAWSDGTNMGPNVAEFLGMGQTVTAAPAPGQSAPPAENPKSSLNQGVQAQICRGYVAIVGLLRPNALLVTDPARLANGEVYTNVNGETLDNPSPVTKWFNLQNANIVNAREVSCSATTHLGQGPGGLRGLSDDFPPAGCGEVSTYLDWRNHGGYSDITPMHDGDVEDWLVELSRQEDMYTSTCIDK